MKLKLFFSIFSCFLFLSFFSCDDNLNEIGQSIQPPSDTISIVTDTISLKAKTISMLDSVYARTINGVLGKYEDDVFGTIKADYLCQFAYPGEDMKFKGELSSIDSVQFLIGFSSTNFIGDSTALMGLSVYPVTSALDGYYYTNADPSKYCDMKESLVNKTYSVSTSNKVSSSTRSIIADLEVSFGQHIYNGWKNGDFNDLKSFNDFFKGTYVTTNFGSESLINILGTSIDIYYKYNDVLGNHDGTKDTIRTALFSLSATTEVIQLNQIKNKNPESLFIEDSGQTYLKTPAGVYTQITIPIADIVRNMQDKKMSAINSALFAIKGFSEKESNDKYGLSRPNTLLLIDKDSVDSFFKKRLLPANIDPYFPASGRMLSFSAAWEKSTNSYSFGNISSMISEYRDKGVDNVTFCIIPIEVQTTYVPATSTSTAKYVPTSSYNYLKPGSAIFRNNLNDMRLELVYSKF